MITMKRGIFILLLFAVFATYGQLAADRKTEKQYNRIIRKMENNLDKNYATSELQPICYSEYTFDASSNHLFNATYIEGVKRPVWFFDHLFYQKKYSIESLTPVRYWTARMYEDTPGERYGSLSFEDAFGYMPFVLDTQNSLAQHVTANAKRRRQQQEKNRDNRNINLPDKELTIDNTIVSRGNTAENYRVVDTLYENRSCYKLVRSTVVQTIYREHEQEQFEQKISNNGFIHAQTREAQAELRRLADLWGDAVYTKSVERIIAKDDYALLSLCTERFIETATGKYLVARWEDKFAKAGKKYKQILYTSLSRRYVPKTTFLNENNIYTYIISRPLLNPPPVEEAQTYRNKIRQTPVGYEDFAIRQDSPDKEMLEEWEIFIENL